MAENVENWWKRRQRSKGVEVPYPVGSFRADWERYPVLIRQFHPDLNGFITLTQIPPAAEVYLLWQCESGHRFVATPQEQRDRPGTSRRRSLWCPECTRTATSRSTPGLTARRDAHPPTRSGAPAKSRPVRPAVTASRTPASPGSPRSEPRLLAGIGLSPGTAFHSERAPVPASAAEAHLREQIMARLDLDFSCNAVRVRRPFHERMEVWPDIVMPDLKVAIEYDTTGRSAAEHVGGREKSDRRKDRLLREVGWEVIRIRTSKLQPLGTYDVLCSGITAPVIERVVDRLREIRGDLIIAAYSRER